MSTIPISLTEKQFDAYVRPYLSTAKRGYESKIPLYKIFNYMLYRLHRAVSGSACRLTQTRTTQKKRNQSRRCLLSFSQVERRW